jgi:hypothetical protein
MFSAATGQPIASNMSRRCLPLSGASCPQSRCVERQRWEATSSDAMSAVMSGIASTAAEIGTTQSASRWPGRNGSRTANPSFSEVPYFHVVFTMPEEIAAIACQNKEVV